MSPARLPWWLLSAHTTLIAAAALIHPRWDDMSPAYLVFAAIHWFDKPVHLLVQAIAGNIEFGYAYLLLLLVLGGAMWWAIGWGAVAAGRGILRLRRRPHAVPR